MNPALGNVPKFEKFIDKGIHIKFEKADLHPNKKQREDWFDLCESKGWLPSMIAHREASRGVFEWKNFDEWFSAKKVSLPYPPEVSTTYPDFVETEEKEEELTKKFVSENPTSLEGFQKFLTEYDGDNSMVLDLKNEKDHIAIVCFNLFQECLRAVMNEEKTRQIAIELHKRHPTHSFHLLQRIYYILTWYFQSSKSMCVGSYGRLVEHWWDGVGEWKA